jgi:hypothetical protein
MKNATVHEGHMINEFELIQACDDFEKVYPVQKYNVYPGNECVWISTGVVNLYYIFQDGKISQVQVD